MDTINSHDEPNRTDSLAKVLVAAMEAHPCLRIGQLVWNAAFMARKQSEICSREGNDANVFYITDEALAEGLDMIAREKSLPGDKATQLAEMIKSYLTRKTGVMLDDETMDHISKLIRDI